MTDSVTPPAVASPVPAALAHLHREAAKAVVGQTELLDLCLMSVLCRGHALIEGAPGLAKTLAVKVFARLLGLEYRRVQATPDLLPGDILGSSILIPAEGRFQFRPGPVFTDLLLVDEINRMPPRTQSALLEAMQERQVSLEGEQRLLPAAFTVFATQNPIEFEGTYPLPEAQLDRFLLKIAVAYPPLEDELTILGRERIESGAATFEPLGLVPFPAGLLREAQAAVQAVTVTPAVLSYTAELIRRSRDWPALSLGASPRAGVALLMLSRALAAADGRDFVLPDDVKAAFLPVLRHRVSLRPEADLEGFTADSVLKQLLAAVPVPTANPAVGGAPDAA